MGKALDQWIELLGMESHPEGGYFVETYQSPDILQKNGLPDRYTSDRFSVKVIYFLLPADQVSKFHRLKCEEVWCYHCGASLTLSMIAPDGILQHVQLGPDWENGEQFHIIIPHGVWFGARVNPPGGYSLVSCLTVPGFEFADFELADRQQLFHEYPQHTQIIEMLT